MQTEIQVALRDKKLTKTEAVELLNSNLEELAKLSSLSEGLLKLARQDESVQMEFTTLSLDAIVSAAAERVATAAKHRKISIIYEVTNLKIEGNYDALVELLVILLDNAIKYSPQKTSVEVVAVDHRSHVDVSIKDQGVGIRASDQEHIFERFYRADNSRSAQNASGHGLGLSIAKNIADIHGARLSVSSPGPQQGATFTVRLNKS